MTTAGADAHAQIAVWRSSDPVETRASIPIPSYESSFRALSVHVRPERALTGDAVADAAAVLRAIRAGHLYTSVDGLATPPAFEFSAANASGTAREGDELPAAGGPVRLHVRSNAPASFTTTICNGARGALRRSPRTRVHSRGAGRGRGVLGRDPGRGHTRG